MNHDYLELEILDRIQLLENCLVKLDDILIIVENKPGYEGNFSIQYVNDAFTKISGYTREEILGQSPKILQGPKTDKHTILQIRKAIAEESILKTEILNYTKNGKEYWISFHLIPVSVDKRRCSHFMGISTDITAFKEAEKDSLENKERLDFVLEVANFGYWHLDVETDETTRSLKHDQLFGHKEMLPKWNYDTFLSHVYEQDRERVDQAFTNAKSNGTDYDIEFRCEWPDGSMHWLWSKGRFLTDDQDNIIGAAGIQSDITEKKKTETVIHQLAYQDPLTSLPNKHSFSESLKRYISKCRQSGEYGALLFMDVDDFKKVNDLLGHNIGDQLLVTITQRMQDKLRNVDVFARFGGDEFVIVPSELGTDLTLAKRKTDDIHQRIAALFEKPFFCSNHEIYSSLSIGTTIFDATIESESELLRQADLAMYKAKNSGKNTVRYFEDAMRSSLLSRTTIEKELRNAISNKELFLCYQPKLDPNNQLLGFEALIRWRHPTKGVIPPLDFIPIAEDSGLILTIGQWVLDEASRTLNNWRSANNTKNLTLSVNISPKEFLQLNFVDQVISSAVTGKDYSNKLILEITENTLLENFNQSIEKINQLTRFGISFSLDDFGTGYSSLNYLKRLPIKEIKIDRSFVSDILVDQSDQAIVSAIINIAEKLNLTVVAEGVETHDQFEYLKDLNCKIFQGYYFSQPMSELDAFKYAQ